ncbi:MAG: acyl-CoA dehydrogenase family protein [Solirubrobacterales bacterium]
MTYLEELKSALLADGGASLARLLANMSALASEADEVAGLPEGLFAGVDVRTLNCFFLPPEPGVESVLRDSVARCVLSELLGYADPALTVALPGPGLTLAPVLDLAGEDQRRRYLARFARAEPTWAAFAMSEPSGGSNATHLSTTATLCGDGFRLDGEKCLIGNGGRASLILVYATTASDRGQFGISPFLVDSTTLGLRVQDDRPMLGLRAVRVASLYFEDCRIPPEALLGSTGGPDGAAAFLSAQRSWEYMRPALSAVMVGATLRMLDDLEATEGGLPRRARESVVDLAARVRPRAESVRLLAHHAAALFDLRRESAPISSMAKVAAASLAKDAVSEALRVVLEAGAAQSTVGWDVSRWARDFQAFEVLEGTTEVHRLMISRAWAGRARRREHRRSRAGAGLAKATGTP